MISLILIIYQGFQQICQVKQKEKFAFNQYKNKNVPRSIARKQNTAFTSSFHVKSSKENAQEKINGK